MLKFGIILIQLLLLTSSTDYAEEVSKYCSEFDIIKHGEDGPARIDEREDNKQLVGLSYDDIKKLRQDSEYTELLKGPEAILLILSFLLILGSLSYFIVFLVNLCCCK